MKLDKYNIHKYIIDGYRLYCPNIGITSIEDIPDNITHLYCYKNKLTSLPKFPDGLIGLYCSNNNLTSLPKIPDSLVYLFCNNNQLTSYPVNSMDKQWRIQHNKLLNRINIINKIYETK